ncbi:MAG: HYR domain-containing protein [Bacteroidota bacterium]
MVSKFTSLNRDLSAAMTFRKFEKTTRWTKFWLVALMIGLFGGSNLLAQCNLIDFTNGNPQVTLILDADGSATLDQEALVGIINPQGVGCSLFFYEHPSQAVALGASVEISCDGDTPYGPGLYFVVADDDGLPGGNESNPLVLEVFVQDTIAPTIAGGGCGMTYTGMTGDDDSDDCDTYVTFPIPVITENCFTSTTLTITYTATTGGTLVNVTETISNAALQDSLAAWAVNGFTRKYFSSTTGALGSTTVNFSITDGTNAPASCNVIVEVTDDEAPQVDCPADITVSTTNSCIATGIPGISLSGSTLPLTDRTFFDNCGVASVEYMLSGSTTLDWTTGMDAGLASFNLGLNTVTYRITDFNDNSVTCDFDVTVIDQVGPTFVNCPSNITMNVINNCDTMITWTAPGVTDNCDPSGASVLLTSSHTSGVSTFDIGTTTVTYRAVDAAGNESICTFDITIVDNGKPSISCPGEQILLFCDPTDLVPDYTNLGMVTDNCPNFVVEQASAGLALNDGSVDLRDADMSGGPSAGDTLVVELVAFDDAGMTGLSDSCSFTVILANRSTGYTNPVPSITGINLPPADFECGSLVLTTPTARDSVCPPNLLYGVPSISSGSANLTAASMDGMGNVTSYNFTSTSMSSVSITWTYTDAQNRTSTQFQTINIVADNGPVLTSGITAITLNLDANGDVTVMPSDFFARATDDCDPNPVITINGLSSISYDCSDIGVQNAVLLATDNQLNASNGIPVTITIQDNIDPVLLGVPAAVTVECDNIPALPTIGVDIVAIDNCGVTGITPNEVSTQSGITNDCSHYNYTRTRSWTASDPSGNQTTFSQVITVRDTEQPVFSTADTIFASADNNCLAAINYVVTADSVSDNCAAFADLTINNGNLSGNYTVGVTTRFITAIDPCGNSAVKILRIVVTDDTPPIAACLGGPSSVSLPPSDTLILPPNFFNNGSVDNCDFLGLNNFSLSRDTFTCVNAGLTFPVTMTVTDNSGNSASCNTTIQIQDNIAPVAFCKDVTVTLDNSGFAGLAASDLDDGSFDNCTGTVAGTGLLNFTSNQLTFGPVDVNNSPVAVELFVQDAFGNRDTCTSNVTVNVPETCFDVILDNVNPPGNVSGTAATVVSVPVVVTNFINVQGFQFRAVIEDPMVANFEGVSGNMLPGTGFVNNIVTSDTMDIQWFNNAATNNPATLADGTTIFNLDVRLVGNVNESTRIKLIGDNTVVAEITRSYNGVAIRVAPCTEDGIVIINNPAQLNLAGIIRTEAGDEVGNAMVTLTDLSTGGANGNMTTGADGMFSFNPVPAGRNYNLRPQKNINWINGVSALDLSIIQKHIVGIDTLNSPYKKIAADAFPDNSITTFDVVQLYQLLQTAVPGPPTTPQGNTSWRFVPADAVLPDLPRRLVPTFNDNLTINNLSMDSVMNNFVGVKVGQVEDNDPGFDPLNATSSGGGSSQTRSGAISLSIDDMALIEGETYELVFRAQDFQNILAYQSVLEFDPTAISFESALGGSLQNFGAANIGTHAAAEGLLTLVWFDAIAADLPNDEALFSLTFKANKNVDKLSEVIQMGDFEQLPNTAYNANNEAKDVQLVFNSATAAKAEFKLYQNRPNPFRDQTIISFSLPKSGFATLSVLDVSGRVIKTYEDQFEKGYNEIPVNSSELPSAGVLYYQLDTDGFTAVKKMVIIE